MRFPLDTQTIAKIAAPKCPQAVAANWPLIEAALEREGIYSDACAVAAIATIAIETAWTFKPIHELGSEQYLDHLYDQRADLGNTPALDGDGARYCGRGFVQITGRNNYRAFGTLVGVDLVSHPEKAMEPETSAKILALFFKFHGLGQLADQGRWADVRRRVNGGVNGLQDFLDVVHRLLDALGIVTHAAMAAKA